MGPLVLIGKGLVLGGFNPSKIEVIWVPGIYIYNYIYIYIFLKFPFRSNLLQPTPPIFGGTFVKAKS